MSNNADKNTPLDNYKDPSSKLTDTGKGHGAQGVDKAPGEETPKDEVNFKEKTQQGKQQVDADVTNPGDRSSTE